MKETWRWFGLQDLISLDQIKQAGATGIVSALHHIYRGEAWPLDEVLKRKAEIEAAGLVWSVVESIPVHNSIKLRSGPLRQYIAAWKESLAAIAKAGVPVVCYNFMPLVAWTRTNLSGACPARRCLRFDAEISRPTTCSSWSARVPNAMNTRARHCRPRPLRLDVERSKTKSNA